MTSPPQPIQVRCPRCGTDYWDWERGSVNLELEGWDPEDPETQAYLRECSTATCPEYGCGFTVDLEMLTVERGGVWRFKGA